MVFSSDIFLFLFLPAVFILYFNPLVKSRKYKNMVLLFSSIIFYAWGEPLFVFIMIAVILINWFIGIKISKSANGKTIWGGVAITVDIFLLVVFKYLSFITQNIANLIHNKSLIIEIALPVGISFFSFQMMSYILDIVSGKAKVQRNPLNVILYVMMFPQLIAGPIVRYATVADEIDSRQENYKEFTAGIIRFVYGLGKKVLISNYLASVVDAVFIQAGKLSVASAWLGAICYTFQIYFDFSGYSDMAIGLGLIFGFHFPENFNYPYIAKSVNDFWRRWHISLSVWFRDYMYIPLGGNRTSKPKWIRNLFIVWFITGIWHGANWTFIIWGILYFCFLTFEKWIGIDKIERHKIMSQIYTGLVVIIAWVIFRADTLMDAAKYLKNMVGLDTLGLVDDMFFRMFSNCKVPLIFAIIFSYPVYSKIKNKVTAFVGQIIDAVSVSLIFSFSLLCCITASYSPFIYFNF